MGIDGLVGLARTIAATVVAALVGCSDARTNRRGPRSDAPDPRPAGSAAPCRGPQDPRPDAGIRHLADEMLAAMRPAHGLGLAAPQVGEPLALAIIEVEGRLLELANPVLVRASGAQVGWEGCLSVPGALRAYRGPPR